jgi:tetratricopeptide (TPR) repeat protein
MLSHKAKFTTIVILLTFITLAPQAHAQEPEEAEVAPTVNLGEAKQLARDGDFEGAEEVLSRQQVEFPDDPRLLLLHGEVLLTLKEFAEAQTVLAHGVAVAPEMPRLNFQLAGALTALGDTSAAIEAFGREIGINEDPQIRHLAHMNRYLMYSDAESWDQAAGELEAVLEINASDSQIYGDLATLYLQADRLEDCSRTLARGLESGFQSAQHYYSLGARHYNDGQYETAAKAFFIALEIQPAMARAERSLAQALGKLERTEEMTRHLKRYLELAPDAPDAEEVVKKIEAAAGS